MSNKIRSVLGACAFAFAVVASLPATASESPEAARAAQPRAEASLEGDSGIANAGWMMAGVVLMFALALPGAYSNRRDYGSAPAPKIDDSL